MVQEAARSGNENIDSAMQLLFLEREAHPAIDESDAEGEKAAVGSKTFGNLDCEFPRRCQDQGPETLGPFRLQALEDRPRKSRGFPRTGLGAPKEIFSCVYGGDCFLLDGGGSFISLTLDSAKELGLEAQLSKGHV